MASGTDARLTGIWGSSPTDIYAVSSFNERIASQIIHYDGTRWSTVATYEGIALRAIWGSASNDVFAVGWGGAEDGVLLHYNGNAWSTMVGPGVGMGGRELSFFSVWGTSGSNVFAGGSTFDFEDIGVIAQYDGTTWSSVTLAETAGRSFLDIYGTSATDVWAVGYADFVEFPADGILAHFDGLTWSDRFLGPEGFTFSGVWASGPDDVFLVGSGNDGAGIHHWDGQTWTAMSIPPVQGLRDVWGTSPTDVYAVGVSTILHYDGTSWTEVRHAQPTFHGVWGSSSTDVFVVGSNGTIFHGTP
jgi:hypothetical protein